MSSTSSNIIKDLAWSSINPKEAFKVRSLGERVIAKCKDISLAVSQRLNLFKEVESGLCAVEEPANRFLMALKRIEFHHAYLPTISPSAPYGYFRNRAIIGENTKVQSGIFISHNAAEAIVVDEKYGSLSKILTQLLARISTVDPTKSSYEYEVFSQAINLVRENLRYSEEGVEQLHSRYRIQTDEKVTLDLYVQKKVGISRHQVLLAAFLLEKLIEKGLLRGRFTIDNQFSTEIPHERLVFTSLEGEILRFDPTKGLGRTAIH